MEIFIIILNIMMNNILGYLKDFSTNELQTAKNSLSQLPQFEDLVLSQIFECNENINACLLKLLSIEEKKLEMTDKIRKSIDDLKNNLNLKREDLFEKFYLAYCDTFMSGDEFKEKIIGYDSSFSDIPADTLCTIDTPIRSNLAKLVFRDVSKDMIVQYMRNVKFDQATFEKVFLDYVKESLWCEISDTLDKHIKDLFDNREYIEKSLLKNFWENNSEVIRQFFDEKMDDMKAICEKDIEDQIIEKVNSLITNIDQVNFQDFMILIDYITIISLNDKYINENFDRLSHDYLDPQLHSLVNNVWGFESPNSVYQLLWEMSDSLWYNWDINGFSHDVFVKNVWSVLQGFYQHIFDIASESDKKDLVQWLWNAMNGFDADENFEKVQGAEERIYLENTDEVYGYLLWQFINEVKKIYKKKFATADLDKKEREDLVSQLMNKHGDMPKKVWWGITWVSKWKKLKQDFCNESVKTDNAFIMNLMDKLQTHESEIKSYPYRDLLSFFWVLLCVISDVELDFKNELKTFTENYVEQLFQNYRQDVDKKNKMMQEMKEKLQASKAVAKNENLVSEPVKVEQKEKKTLPEQMISDLEKYFGWVIDQKLERYLKNCGGEYKTIWFREYDVDEWFFDILHEYNYVCIDVDELESTELSDGVDHVDIDKDVDINESQQSPEDIKLKEILWQVDAVETISEKVNLFIQAFKLFYDIFDEDVLTEEISQCCRDNREVLNGIESVLDMLSKWQKEQVRSSKNRVWKYYKFDIWRSWYRLVLQNQKWSSRRIIIDFANHDTYEWRCDYYYNFWN